MTKTFLLLALAAAPAAAQLVNAPLPAAPKLATPPALGSRPAETRLPMLASLDLTRLTPVIAPLGGKDYQVSIAPMRGVPEAAKGAPPVSDAPLVAGDAWAVTLIPVGAKKFDIAESFPFPALRRQPLDAELGGKAYKVSLIDGIDLAVRFEAAGSTVGGLQLPVTALKRAVWDAAAPIPAMGPEWRFAFNVDLWIGAGMRSFVFMRKQDDGTVEFYRTGAEAVDETRPVLRRVGPQTVSLQLDEKAQLVITPVQP